MAAKNTDMNVVKAVASHHFIFGRAKLLKATL